MDIKILKNTNIEILINRSLNHTIKYILFNENKEDAFETSILGSFKINEFKNCKHLFNTLAILKNEEIFFSYNEFLKILNLSNYDFLYLEKDLKIFNKIKENINKEFLDEEIFVFFKNLVNKTFKYFLKNKHQINLIKTQQNKDFNNLINFYYLNDETKILNINLFNDLNIKGLTSSLLIDQIVTFNPLD